jgi:hypothetical protein
MGHLIERTAQNLFITASTVKENGKKRKIVIESRGRERTQLAQEES